MALLPREFVGAARAFRAAIAAEDAVAVAAVKAIFRPLYARSARNPHPRPSDLVDAARKWRVMIPSSARLWLNIDSTRNSLRIDEVRCSAIAMRFVDWLGDDMEPGVSLLHVRIHAESRNTFAETSIIAAASLHALARRLQRSFDTTRDAVMQDLGALAGGPKGAGDEQEIAAADGSWRGMMVSLRAGERTERAWVARTYIGRG